MKSWWIFVVLALLLLAWGFRESFTSYEDALKDVGQTSGYISLTPVCPVGSVINAEKTKCKFTDTTKTDVAPTCSSDTLELVGGVCRRKSGPMGGTTTGTGTSSGATGGTTSGTTSGTTAGVTAGATGASTTVTTQPPTCPSGKTPEFAFGSYTCRSVIPRECPGGFPVGTDRDPILGFNKCYKTRIGEGEMRPGVCPAGTVSNGYDVCYGGETPVCAAGYTFKVDSSLAQNGTFGTCVSNTPVGTTTGATAGATGGTTSSGTTTPATQSSTGGSSTSSYGPNSGGSSGNMKGIFGPTFTGIGDGGNVRSTDSSKTNKYPELMGGGGGKSNTNKSGVGSGIGIGIGSLTGGMSSQPGDKDLIPDPFRVSQQFSASNYSFKTDPMPFLTDFSAFSK